MNENFNRRRFQRIDFDASTELVQGERRWAVELHDLSLKGLLVHRPDDWDLQPGLPLTACIRLADDVQVSMDVLLVRDHDGLLGLACQHIDLESMSHLPAFGGVEPGRHCIAGARTGCARRKRVARVTPAAVQPPVGALR